MSDTRQQLASGRKQARHRPSEATVRIGTVLPILRILQRLGADPAEVLAEVGLDLELFDNPDNLIAYAARSRLLSHCVARTRCPHFGLLVGQEAGLDSLGLVGLLVKYSPDVGTALHSLVRYMHLHVRGATPVLAVDGDLVILSYLVHQPHAEAADQIGDGAVALMFNILGALCGPDWRPVEVQFAHRTPKDLGPFRRFFRCPLRFDAERYALVFFAHWLGHSVPRSDAELRRHLQKQIDELEGRYGGEFPEQVRSVLRTALLTNRASAEQVAAFFSMHSRTLNRRLNAFGLSFRELVDEGRFEIARQMLEDSALDVIQIAQLLDYADASAFTRAFRRWSGTTPARWRVQRKGVPLNGSSRG